MSAGAGACTGSGDAAQVQASTRKEEGSRENEREDGQAAEVE